MTELAPWITSAANGWERRRIRTLGHIGSGSGFPPSLQGQADLDVPFYKVKHLGQASPEGVVGTADDTISHETAESLGATVFPAGTLVYAKVGAALMLGRVRVLPVAACIDNNMAGLAPSEDVDARFLFWAMSQVKFGYLVNPGAVPSLSNRNLLDYPLLIPIRDEQRAIADYLDRETARIDTLIEEQQRLIEMLHERRAAAIEEAAEAVQTTGQRLKHIIRSVRQGWSPQCYPWPADSIDTWAVLKAGAANGGVFRPMENKELPETETPRPEIVVSQGDLIVSRANTRDLVGSAAVVDGDYPRLMLSDKLYAFTLDEAQALPRFVAVILGSRRWRDMIELEATGASHSMLNVSQSDIVNLAMPLPSLDDQRRILSMLDKQTAKIDALIAETERFIELSKERRAALITAAVTGQVDVRETV